MFRDFVSAGCRSDSESTDIECHSVPFLEDISPDMYQYLREVNSAVTHQKVAIPGSFLCEDTLDISVSYLVVTSWSWLREEHKLMLFSR